jgi:hypothetical protein
MQTDESVLKNIPDIRDKEKGSCMLTDVAISETEM